MLLEFLFGESAETAQRGASERLMRWAEAFDEWLEARRTRFSPNVGEDSHRAWAEFLALTRKVPWDVQVEDVQAYIEALEGKGLRAGTIQGRLTGLKKFYEHCQEQGIDAQCPAGRSSIGQIEEMPRNTLTYLAFARYRLNSSPTAGRGVFRLYSARDVLKNEGTRPPH
jgi:hypothetical protein